MAKTPKQGDTVSWDTPQGKTQGTVEKVVTSTTKVKGHTEGHQGEARGDGEERQVGQNSRAQAG